MLITRRDGMKITRQKRLEIVSIVGIERRATRVFVKTFLGLIEVDTPGCGWLIRYFRVKLTNWLYGIQVVIILIEEKIYELVIVIQKSIII